MNSKRYNIKVKNGSFSYPVDGTNDKEEAKLLKDFYSTIYEEVEIVDNLAIEETYIL